jgi:hypothetical protein
MRCRGVKKSLDFDSSELGHGADFFVLLLSMLAMMILSGWIL